MVLCYKRQRVNSKHLYEPRFQVREASCYQWLTDSMTALSLPARSGQGNIRIQLIPNFQASCPLEVMVVCHFFGVRSLQRHPMTAMVSLITHWSTVCLSACPILTTIKIVPFQWQLVCGLISIVCDIKPILDKTESNLDMATVCLLFLDNAYDNDSNALWGTSVMNLFDFIVQATWKFDLVIVNQHHYSDVTMGVMASQITSLTIVYSTVYSGADLRNIKAPRHWPLWGEFTAQMASNA